MPGFSTLALKVRDSGATQIVFLPTRGLLLRPVKHSNLKAPRGFEEINICQDMKVRQGLIQPIDRIDILLLVHLKEEGQLPEMCPGIR
jgi:hypothetical protein